MNKKILVIDDERAIRDSFDLALSDDYDVTTAENGIEGLELLEQLKPDMIFLDLKMPEMDGVETMRRIKTLNPIVPVYIVTAFQKEFMEPLAEASKEGIEFEIAAKPLSSEQIRNIASAVLSE